MNGFAVLSPEDQGAFFVEAAARLSVADIIIEKDFWVCWNLRHLFALQERHRLLFRGGTSLSKAHGLIRRFSEDIDITIHRHDLGFDDPRIALREMSRKRRDQWHKSLKEACVE